MKETLKILWLNLTFYPLLVLYSLAATLPLALLGAVLLMVTPLRFAMRQFRRTISRYGSGVIHVLPWPLVRVRYEDTSPDTNKTASIVVCNHRSSSDPFLMACLPCEIVQIVNVWPFRLPLWGIAARLAGYLSINEMAPQAFMEKAGQLLRDGVTVVAFPEGTRSGGRAMGPFHGAVFRLALQEKVPIVPLCISGNERIPARGTLLLRPGRVTLRRLPPLTWEDYKDLTPFQLKNKVHDRIRRELDAMETRV